MASDGVAVGTERTGQLCVSLRISHKAFSIRFSLAMAAGRGLADRLDGRFGAVALVRGGSLLAAAGLTVR